MYINHCIIHSNCITGIFKKRGIRSFKEWKAVYETMNDRTSKEREEQMLKYFGGKLLFTPIGNSVKGDANDGDKDEGATAKLNKKKILTTRGQIKMLYNS